MWSEAESENSEAVRDEFLGKFVRWDTRSYTSSGPYFQFFGDGLGIKVVFWAVGTSAYCQAPVVFDQYLIWKMDRKQTAAGPLCVRRGVGAGPKKVVLRFRVLLRNGTMSTNWGAGSCYRTNVVFMKEKLHEAFECNTGEFVRVDADLAKEATFTTKDHPLLRRRLGV